MEGFAALTVFTLIFTSFVSIFWMITDWRAMRAHEKLADMVEWLVRQQSSTPERQSSPLGDD